MPPSKTDASVGGRQVMLQQQPKKERKAAGSKERSTLAQKMCSRGRNPSAAAFWKPSFKRPAKQQRSSLNGCPGRPSLGDDLPRYRDVPTGRPCPCSGPLHLNADTTMRNQSMRSRRCLSGASPASPASTPGWGLQGASLDFAGVQMFRGRHPPAE